MTATKTTLKGLAERRTDIFHIDPRKLKVKDGLNIRTGYDRPEDMELAQNIAVNGVKVPMLVFEINGEFIVSDGHRRFHAAMRAINELKAEIQTVPVQSGGRGYNEQEATIDMFTRNSGLPLTPVEKAEGIRRLMAFGFSAKEIANRIGMTEATVSNYKTMLAFPKNVQNAIRNNQIASTMVLELARKHAGSPETLEQKVEEIVKAAEASGRKRATKKDARKVDPEEATVRIGKMKLIALLETAEKGLRSTSENNREKARLEVEEFLATLKD